MNKSKRVMRRLILSRLYDRLNDQYTILYPRETFLRGELSRRDIDALLAFKSDSYLEDLRRALERIDNDTYGICIGCKSSISQELLDNDPTQRICSSCEQKLVHPVPLRTFHHLAT